MQFSCILMGQDTLLVQCAKHLIERNHQIQWVVTTTPFIQLWCDEQQIPHVGSIEELPEPRKGRVDYFFSIVNGKILSADDLKIAKKASINYHDALLPSYAGVHATTWALINDEKEHGISWHLINEGIDRGDLVYQIAFPVSETETALSLNLRCFDAAEKGFIQIVHEIETNALKPYPQSQDNRSYYGLKALLPYLGFIHWASQDAETIARYCRALNFGNYNNAVGTLKLYLSTDFLTVGEVLISNTSRDALAGTLLAIQDDGLLIATKTQPIWLKQLKSKSGKTINTEALVKTYGLSLNQVLPGVEEALDESHDEQYKIALAKAPYWLSQLQDMTEHSFFTDRMGQSQSKMTSLSQFQIDTENFSQDPTLILFAAVLLYLYRINNYESFGVYFQPEAPLGAAGIFADLLPFSLNECHSEMSIADFLQWAKSQLQALNSNGRYLNDSFVRMPALSSRANEAKDFLITLGFQSEGLPEKSFLHFEMDKNAGKTTIYHRINPNYSGKALLPLLENMAEHLQHILQRLQNSPDLKIHQFSFLGEQERERLMSWSMGEYRPLPSNTISDMFAQRVRFSPEKTVCLRENEGPLTYQELAIAVDQVAAFLMKKALKPMAQIGIQMTDPYRQFLLSLGILKSGGICVPLRRQSERSDLDYVIQAEDWPKIAECAALEENHSLAKQDAMLLKAGMLNQKQWINYAFWLARTQDIDAESIVEIEADMPMEEAILHSISALLVGAELKF